MSGNGGGNTAIGQPGFNPNGPGNPSFRSPGGVMNQPGFGAQANGSGSAMATGGNYNPNGYAGLQSQGYQGGTGGTLGSATGTYAPAPGSVPNGGPQGLQKPNYLADPNMGGGDAGGGPAPVQAGYAGGDQPGGLLGGGFQNNGWGQDVNTMNSTSNPVSPLQMQYIRATQAAHPGMANQLAMRQAGPAPRMNEDGTMQAQRDHGMMPMSDAQRAQIAQQQIAPGGPMSVAQQYQSLGPGANQFIANQIPQLQNGISRTSGTFDPNNAFNGGGIRPEDQQALQQQLARYQAMQTYGQGR